MSDYLTFEGAIEPVTWGKAVYTVLRVPPEVSDRLEALGAKRVEGEMNDHPVNLALSRAPVVDGVFLWAGKSLLNSIGVKPGESFEVRLRPADAAAVEVPEDVRAGLRQSDVWDEFEALTPGRQRGELYKISTAKRAETRAKRIAALAADLGAA